MSGHYDWCGRGHHCTELEHRSAPLQQATPWGSAVVVRVQRPGGRPWAVVTLSVLLDGDEEVAAGQAGALGVELPAGVEVALSGAVALR